MTADLSGLTPIREFSRKTLEAAYPGGQAEVPEKDLLDDINRRLYGTGTSMGIYGQFAGRGIVPVPTAEGKMDIPPELNYSSVRAILQSKQDLLNQIVEADARRLGGHWQEAGLGEARDGIDLEHLQPARFVHHDVHAAKTRAPKRFENAQGVSIPTQDQ